MSFAVIAASLLAAPEPTIAFCRPGAPVEGLAAGSWHPATAVKATPGGGCEVRMVYSGIEDVWDLPPEKVRPRAPVAAAARAPDRTAGGLCRKGSAVEVRLQQRWFPATVAEDGPRADGTCRIVHRAYAGTDNAHDVPPSDLRTPQGVPAQGSPDAPTGKALIDTTPERIYDSFKRYPEAAAQRMIGAPVRITGTADSVDDKNVLFKLNNYELVAQCLVEPADRAALRTVRPGAKVVVEGVATNKLGPTSVRLQNCRIVGQTESAPAPATPGRPPVGRYYCMNAGSSVGNLQLGADSYSIAGVTGRYRYDPATSKFAWNGGSFAKWGWSGTWRTDSVLTNGPAEPRIELTDGKSLHVHCFPKS